MKFFLAIGTIVLVASCTYAVPPSENNDSEYGGNQGVRQRRITCDLLSIQVKGIGINDGACAANCLTMGKAGGRCNNGICECRKTTFGELWKQRFG